MSTLIVYHNDADGECAAAIVLRHYRKAGSEPKVIPVDYGKEQDARAIDAIRELNPAEDDLWIVDYSFKPDVFRAEILGRTWRGLFWFDHHIPSLDKLAGELQGIDLSLLCGTREGGEASCLSVWRYLNDGRQAPMAVQYIADRDVWMFQFGSKSKEFHEMFLTEEDTSPSASLWDKYFEMAPWHYDAYCAVGAKLLDAKRQEHKRLIRRFGVPEWYDPAANKFYLRDGEVPPVVPSHKVLVLNAPGTGDLGASIQDEGYDIAWCWVAGRAEVRHSLYSSKVDVAEIAKKLGGGGHKGAAGWTSGLDYDGF